MIIIMNPLAVAGLYSLAFLFGYFARPPHQKQPRKSLGAFTVLFIITVIGAWLSHGHLWEFTSTT